MNRSYYSASIESFLATLPDAILGELTRASEFSVDQTQAVAWVEQINILKSILQQYAPGHSKLERRLICCCSSFI